jgi:RNA polymerase sigma-32 factor
MDNWSIVKIGTTQSQRKLFYRLNKEKRRLESLGLYPAPKALAHSLQVKEKEVLEMQVRLNCNDVCLDSPMTAEGTDTMMDLLTSDEDVEQIVSEKQTYQVLSERIKAFETTLNEKEICVLNNRLMADKPKTLGEIGARFHISRERVRQIEQRVLKKAKARFNGDMENLGIWPVCNSQRTLKTLITETTG